MRANTEIFAPFGRQKAKIFLKNVLKSSHFQLRIEFTPPIDKVYPPPLESYLPTLEKIKGGSWFNRPLIKPHRHAAPLHIPLDRWGGGKICSSLQPPVPNPPSPPWVNIMVALYILAKYILCSQDLHANYKIQL